MTDLQPLNISPQPVRLRVEDYLRLDDAGAFADYHKTELIEGQIYSMNAQHRPHARIKSRLHLVLAEQLRRSERGLEAIVEGSVAIPPYNAPEPDILVTAAPEGDGLIPLESVRLVIEVADATLANDLDRKQRVYAMHGVPEYWVVDVNERTTHQMWRPDDGEYAERRLVAFGETIVSVAIRGLSVPTDAL